MSDEELLDEELGPQGDAPEHDPEVAQSIETNDQWFCEVHRVFIQAPTREAAVELICLFKNATPASVRVGRALGGKWAKLGDRVLKGCIAPGTGQGLVDREGSPIPEKPGYEYVVRTV